MQYNVPEVISQLSGDKRGTSEETDISVVR